MKKKETNSDKKTIGRWILILFHLSLLSFPFACVEDITKDTPPIKTAQEEVTFSLRVPGRGDTRALTEADETSLSDIFVLVFDPSTKEFLYMSPGTVKSGSGTSRTFSVTLRTGTFDLLVLANSGKWIAESYPTGIPRGEPREEVEKNLLASLPLGAKWKTTTNDFTPIPFHGSLNSAVINAGSDFTSSPLAMTRSVASIDVKVGIGAESDFTLESIYLYNSRSKGRLVPDATLYAQDKPTVAGSAVTTPLLYKEGDITTVGKASEGAIYTFEAAAGSTQNFRENTCLVIGGSYKNEATSYYRVDFREEQPDGTLTYLPLLGNHKYRVTINSVAYSGWGTADEAFNALPISMQAEIASWELGYDEDINIGQDMFSLSESRFVYPGLNDGEGTPFTGSIEVKSSRGWTYELSESAVGITDDPINWITHTRRNGTNEDVIDFVIEENLGSKRQVYLHFKTENLTHLATVVQRKQNDPNCYIVQLGGEVEFPVRKVFMVWDDEIMGDERIPNLSGSITCGVIWEDVPNLVSVSLSAEGDRGNRSKMRVTAASEHGNAVIGLYVNNILRYSWHIWVTDYDPDTNQNGTTYPHNNTQKDYLFMDRNLGATTATPGAVTTLGLLYQWGRKDPFPGADAITGIINQKTIYGIQIEKEKTPTTEPRISSNNVHNTLLNPFCFYFGYSDWFTTQSRDYHYHFLWMDEDGDKGMFDPCPDGWRVPDCVLNYRGRATHLPWVGYKGASFDLTNRVMKFSNNNDFYPAAGQIINNTGLLSAVGGAGYYWTAVREVSEQSYGAAWSMVLLNYSNSIHAIDYPRACGYSVRCVQDN